MGRATQGDQELSEDEDLAPDKPVFMGLFKPALFKSLLFKAKTTAHVGVSDRPTEVSIVPQDPSEQLFMEPAAEHDVIPSPQLFIDIIQCQWNQPRSVAAPSGSDRRSRTRGDTAVTQSGHSGGLSGLFSHPSI